MIKNRSFTIQLFIIGGFIVFFYIFFILASSIYKEYRLEKHISEFEDRIRDLAESAGQKPGDVAYFSSLQYKDQYAKENLNLLNPGEKIIVIPQEEQKIVKGGLGFGTPIKTPESVLKLANRNQWWEYFFGETLSVKKQESMPPADKTDEPITDPAPQNTQG